MQKRHKPISISVIVVFIAKMAKCSPWLRAVNNVAKFATNDSPKKNREYFTRFILWAIMSSSSHKTFFVSLSDIFCQAEHVNYALAPQGSYIENSMPQSRVVSLGIKHPPRSIRASEKPFYLILDTITKFFRSLFSF